MVHAARHPRRVRWRDTLPVAETAGVNALPIVALVSFFMGLIMAFQAAVPLRQFGAEMFVANLIGLSMLRELGPLMTAIILAGRSGSAFAAELGTMKVREEIDALKTMGLDPVRFLVVTRVVAAVFMTPLLTIFADLIGFDGRRGGDDVFGFPVDNLLSSSSIRRELWLVGRRFGEGVRFRYSGRRRSAACAACKPPPAPARSASRRPAPW